MDFIWILGEFLRIVAPINSIERLNHRFGCMEMAFLAMFLAKYLALSPLVEPYTRRKQAEKNQGFLLSLSIKQIFRQWAGGVCARLHCIYSYK